MFVVSVALSRRGHDWNQSLSVPLFFGTQCRRYTPWTGTVACSMKTPAKKPTKSAQTKSGSSDACAEAQAWILRERVCTRSNNRKTARDAATKAGHCEKLSSHAYDSRLSIERLSGCPRRSPRSYSRCTIKGRTYQVHLTLNRA